MADTGRFRESLALLVHENTQVSRKQIFGSNESASRPISLPNDAETMFAGYVGAEYAPGGLVLLGINPGGGGDAYTRRTSDDQVFYPFLERLKTAPPDARLEAFEDVNRTSVPILQQWNLWRIVRPTIEAAGRTIQQVAYLNAVPYRTRQDKPPLLAAQRRAWEQLTGPFIPALEPAAIVALGMKAGRVLVRFYVGEATTYCVPRTIGDIYLSDQATAVLEVIRDRRPDPSE